MTDNFNDEPQLSEEMEKRFDEVFTNRLLAVTDGKSKDWEDGYNTMVESTRLFMIESKHFLATALEEQRQEYVRKVDELATKWDESGNPNVQIALYDVLAILNGKE